MHHIPYTIDVRADTRVSNVTMGIWLFLASEVMLFGAVFSSYALLRVSADAWPSGRTVLSLTLGGVNTVVLMAMTAMAWRARSMSAAAGSRWLMFSSLFAVAFLVIKGVEWRGEISHGLLPSVNTFFATYFLLTGLHGLHVIGGLIANVWAMTGVRRAGDAMTVGRIRALSLYWAFVDVVWLVIFVLMYLL